MMGLIAEAFSKKDEWEILRTPKAHRVFEQSLINIGQYVLAHADEFLYEDTGEELDEDEDLPEVSD